MDLQADKFLKFDYQQVKDLCVSFLTLISAILVFSITFAEKILKFPQSSAPAKGCLLISWLFFIVAILLSGTALACMFYAGLQANYDQPYQAWGDFAERVLQLGGVFFVGGLIELMLSAFVAYIRSPKP